MPLKDNNATVLQQVNSFLSQACYIKNIHKSTNYSAFRNNATNVLYLEDFYLSPLEKITDVNPLNSLFDRIKSEVDLPEYEIKCEEDRFRIINDVALGFGRIWYEELVARDKIQSKSTREYYDLNLIPAQAIFLEGKKDVIKLSDETDNNPFKNYDIKRRVRLFIYPSEDLALKCFEGKLDPSSSINLKYLKERQVLDYNI